MRLRAAVLRKATWATSSRVLMRMSGRKQTSSLVPTNCSGRSRAIESTGGMWISSASRLSSRRIVSGSRIFAPPTYADVCRTLASASNTCGYGSARFSGWPFLCSCSCCWYSCRTRASLSCSSRSLRSRLGSNWLMSPVSRTLFSAELSAADCFCIFRSSLRSCFCSRFSASVCTIMSEAIASAVRKDTLKNDPASKKKRSTHLPASIGDLPPAPWCPAHSWAFCARAGPLFGRSGAPCRP